MSAILLIVAVVFAGLIAFAIAVWATGRESLEPAPSTAGFPSGRVVDEDAVAAVRFDTGLRGYRSDQVDEALRSVAWELGRRDELIAQLRSQLDEQIQAAALAAEANQVAVEAEPEESPPTTRRGGSVSPLADSSPGGDPEPDSE